MKVVIGVDSGGSKTRALAVTLAGEAAGYAESGGGNATHDRDSRQNVRDAVAGAATGCGVANVVRVVAGVAGMRGHESWASETTAVPGLDAPREHHNDADVGHYAVFGRGPGILSIQGTGSNVFAVTESGERNFNGDFGHYARGGAVWLGQTATYAVLAGFAPGLEAAVCAASGVADAASLRRKMRGGWGDDARAKSTAMGLAAQATTAAAEAGDPDARRLCRLAADEILTGIRLLGPLFAGPEAPVAFVGACVRSAPVRRMVEAGLAAAPERAYRVVEPKVPPVVGAARMALEAEGVALDDAAAQRLAEYVAGR